jgi:hypothetical protein
VQDIEPIAFGLLGLRPAELWNMTPAEIRAIIEAKIQFSPAELMKQRQVNYEEEMTPEQIADKLRMIAGGK